MNDKLITYPTEVGFHGGITYRFFSGGVECELTFADESGFIRQTGFAKAPLEHTEHYSIRGMANEALRIARQSKAEGISPDIDIEKIKQEGREEAINDIRTHLLYIWQKLGLRKISM